MQTKTALRMSAGIVASCVSGVAAAGVTNLVVNGDFEDPTLTGIHSDYEHTPGGNFDDGTWWVSPWDPGLPWAGWQATPFGVAAMNINGDASPQAGNRRVWFQTVSVEPGLEYRFSAWMLATAAGPDGYSLEFAFDGTVLGGVQTPEFSFEWRSFETFLVPMSDSVTISIVDISGAWYPNDFMLDDISLVAVPAPAAGMLLLPAGIVTRRRRRRCG